jgi:serine/threonine protein kinase
MLNESITIKNRYLLIKLLGRGGFSEVWLALDQITSLQVALKIYAPGTGLDDEGIKLFTQEFSLVYDLNHTNLLKPSHYDYFDRMPFLVLPYCEQGSCLKLIGKMPEEEMWNFLYDVSNGLDFLHSRKPPIIHQDIKPDNILINSNGCFVITDFGISTRLRSTLRKSMNKMSSSGGTMAYMAPERFGADSAPIIANDVYSLGITAYELLTGDVPFGEHGGILQKNGAEIPLIKNNCSKSLKNLIYLCLSPQPWKRPTAKQISEYAQQAIERKTVKIVNTNKKQRKVMLYSLSGGAVAVALVLLILLLGKHSNSNTNIIHKEYTRLMQMGDSLIAVGEKEGNFYERDFTKALSTYQEAQQLESKIIGKIETQDVNRKISDVEKQISKAYNNLMEKADKMRQYNEYEAADAFTNRAESLLMQTKTE